MNLPTADSQDTLGSTFRRGKKTYCHSTSSQCHHVRSNLQQPKTSPRGQASSSEDSIHEPGVTILRNFWWSTSFSSQTYTIFYFPNHNTNVWRKNRCVISGHSTHRCLERRTIKTQNDQVAHPRAVATHRTKKRVGSLLTIHTKLFFSIPQQPSSEFWEFWPTTDPHFS